MPDRVKCLHVLVGHSLAAGPGRQPARRRGARGAGRLVGRRVLRARRGRRDAGEDDRRDPGRRAIDCGTNSIRLLVADVDPRRRRRSTDVDCAGWRSSGSARASTAPAARPRGAWRAPSPMAGEYAAAVPRARAPSGSGSSPRRRSRDAAQPRRVRRRGAATLGSASSPRSSPGDEEAALSFPGATGEPARRTASPAAVPRRRHRRRLDRVRPRRPPTVERGPVGRHRLRAADRAAPAQRPADARPRSRRPRADIDAAIDRGGREVPLRGRRDPGRAGRLGHHRRRARAAAAGLRPRRASTASRLAGRRRRRGLRPTCWRMTRAERAALPVHAPRPGRRHRRRRAGLAP